MNSPASHTEKTDQRSADEHARLRALTHKLYAGSINDQERAERARLEWSFMERIRKATEALLRECGEGLMQERSQGTLY